MCSFGAIALVDGKARIDEALCTGCGACVDECPAGAIQPVVHGEMVSAPARPLPTAYRPGPLAETAGAAVVVAGVGLLAKTAKALARAVGRWLMRPSAVAGSPVANGLPTSTMIRGGGRRARHRWRGER